jgi:succinylglutamic semialdehyde dehydrogenase
VLGSGHRLVRRGDYLWGSFVRPERVDGYVVGVNPGDKSDVLGRFAFSTTAVDDAVGAARDGLRAWSPTSVDERAAVMLRFVELLEESAEDLAMLITRETGKPVWESREEVASAGRVARLLANDGTRWLKPKVAREGAAWSDMRAHGVCGVITPFAFPLLIPTLHVLAALLAGNTVVFKPSKFTPGVGQALAERLDRCRLPRGAFNMVQGSGAVIGHRIATHPGIDVLLFAGRWSTAAQIRRATADRPELPVLLQTGGKGAAIVCADADLDRAAYDLAVSAFATSGQRHNSTARVFVHRSVAEGFCERLMLRAQELVIGYGFDEGVFLGPLISDEHRARYRKHGKELVAEGHQPLLEAVSAQVEGRRGYYVRPAIYWLADDSHLGDETVGPLLHVHPVDDDEHAVQLHNRMAYRISSSVFTDLDRADVPGWSARLSTGILNLNRGTIGSSLRLPAVGQGRSANGISADIDLLRFLTTARATLVDRRPFNSTRWVPGTGSIPVAPGSEGDDGG